MRAPPRRIIYVLTFYAGQVRLLKRLLAATPVRVSTVDSAQGSEADVVLVSFVRTERLGFLRDFRRLNVAITRAKSLLLCFGKARTFPGDHVGALVADAHARGLLVPESALLLARR